MLNRIRKHIQIFGFIHFIFSSLRYVLIRPFSILLFILMKKVALMSGPFFIYKILGFGVALMPPPRKKIMSDLFKKSFKEKNKPLKFLEVGTWFGEGSTQLWIDLLPKKSELYLVDAWGKYISSGDSNDAMYQLVSTYNIGFQASHNVLKKICYYEANKNHIDINLLRGKSTSLLKNFKEDTFDLIYIDASHYYKEVKADILAAKNIVNKKFSIICGDDLDKGINSELVKLAKLNLHKNYSDGFHPGVLLAVDESFKKVNEKDGFWWVYCIDGKFTDINDNF